MEKEKNSLVLPHNWSATFNGPGTTSAKLLEKGS